MSHAYQGMHPARNECMVCGKPRGAPAHVGAVAESRKGDEIPRIMRLYMASATARQVLGDLQRSRLALASPEFKQAIDDACRHMDDTTPEYSYSDRKERTDGNDGNR